MSEPRALTHAELVLWLHDHIGCTVTVGVVFEFGEARIEPILMSIPGTLRHHTSANPAARMQLDEPGRDEIVGMYYIGTESVPAGGFLTFNVSDFRDLPALTTEDGGAAIIIAERVAIKITPGQIDDVG